ncbi:MAG: aspartate 1-decarboxylase [Candidatus Methylacidiphilales bacterium]
MQRFILSHKIHRAVVTDAHVDYEGSLSIDEDLMDACGMLPYEKILVGNIHNGARFETYAIAAPRGSRKIVLNGATAHCGAPGDRIVIMTFAALSNEEIKEHQPKTIVLDEKNEIIDRRGC